MLVSEDKAIKKNKSTDLFSALYILLKTTTPSFLVCGFVFFLCTLWSFIDPTMNVVTNRNANFEDLVVSTQIKRSEEIGTTDILLVGDSSSLMGVDVPYLFELLDGKYKIESLSTIANVSPKGHMKLIDNYYQRNGSPKIIIFQLNPITLADGPWVFAKKYEEWVLTGTEPLPFLFVRGRDKIFRDAIAKILQFPMRNEYASKYGWPINVVNFIRNNKGTMIDPGPTIKWDHNSHYFALNLPYMLKLLQSREYIQRIKAEYFFFAFTPNVGSKISPEMLQTRSLVYSFILDILGLDINRQLNLPAVLPDSKFISTHHLNEKGRRLYTEHLASAINNYQFE